MLEQTISNFIEEQFPNIYQEEGPFFIEFMKQYYVWLETSDMSPVYHARRYLPDHDVDTTVDKFIIYFKEKYLKNIQLNTATNTKQLIKNSIDLYRSKGTENAIKLFFDLIFSAHSEVYYPGKDVFKLSDAEYTIPRYVEVTSRPFNRLMVGRSITGQNSGATAFVEKLVRRRIKNNFIEVFYLSAMSGEFTTGEIIALTTPGEAPLEDFPMMIGSLTSLDVEDGGTGFKKGEVVQLESRTGTQGQAIVTELDSVTGIVSFKLEYGGWGYTSNSDMDVSDRILMLNNVHITSTTNTSLYNKITNIQQPMANVQWYDNTAPFAVGDVVYNYYANGSVIGSSRIISAEYGTSNTTNYFLLSNLTGLNAHAPAANAYYTAGNTASFKVQNAGWANVSANATAIGMSSNVFIYCTGRQNNFSTLGNVYQISTNNQIYVSAKIESIESTGSNTFTIKVTDPDGLFLTNQLLLSTTSPNSANILSLSYDIGVKDVTGSFKSFAGNRIKDTANGSLFSAEVISTPFGSGANIDFDHDLVNTEVLSLNPNFVRDHIDISEPMNWINNASYGASLNNASLMAPTLGEALRFESKTVGTIARLVRANPGEGYSYAPFVEAVDPLIAPLAKMDFVIRIASASGVYGIGELVTQDIEGARGLVKFANTSEIHIARLNFEDKWRVGSNTPYLISGESSGHTSVPIEVTYDIEGVAGKNAVISTKVSSSNSAALSLKLIDSGFGFLDGDEISFVSLDNSRAGTAISTVMNSGKAVGFYKSTSGFLSTNKYLYDGDYYQDFSYEIRSPITISRYADMLKSVLHVSGTKSFSAILKSTTISSKARVVSSSVVVANSDIVHSMDFSNANNSFYILLL